MFKRGICNYNYTILWPNYKYQSGAYLDEKKQTIDGIFGKLIENLLGFKRCKLVICDTLGEVYPNGTLTGVFKKFNDKQGDIFYDPKSYYQNSSLVDFTYPVYHQSTVISHSLDLKHKKSEKNILELIDLDCYYLLAYAIIVSAFIFFIAWKLRKRFISYCEEIMSQRVGKYCETTRKHLGQKFSKHQIIAIFFVVLALYFLSFFNQIFIINSFRTSNVLVSTDQIIYNNKQLSLTKKKVWFFERSESKSLIMDSPSDSFLKRTLKEKSSDQTPLLSPNVLGIKLETIREFEKSGFLFTVHQFSWFIINMFISQTKTFYWMSNEFFAYNQCYLFRKSLPENDKKIFKKYSLRSLEGGFMVYSYRESIIIMNHMNTNTASYIYENSLDKIISENTKFISNTFKSFESLFIIYLTIMISILILFALVSSTAFIKYCLHQFLLYYIIAIGNKITVLRFAREHFTKSHKLMSS